MRSWAEEHVALTQMLLCPTVVGDTEGEMVAWCTKPGHGTRLIPPGLHLSLIDSYFASDLVLLLQARLRASSGSGCVHTFSLKNES